MKGGNSNNGRILCKTEMIDWKRADGAGKMPRTQGGEEIVKLVCARTRSVPMTLECS